MGVVHAGLAHRSAEGRRQRDEMVTAEDRAEGVGDAGARRFGRTQFVVGTTATGIEALGCSGGAERLVFDHIPAGLSDKPVRTCSIGFDDPLFNESAFAQTVAELQQMLTVLEASQAGFTRIARLTLFDSI